MVFILRSGDAKMIKSAKLHKMVGLILVLPMLAWTVTGLVFFIKPGYQAAYQQLSIKTYPLSQTLTLQAQPNWQEIKIVRSILGQHLLVKQDNSSRHLDLQTLQDKAMPSAPAVKQLLTDAVRQDPERYGEIVNITGLTATTSTGVELSLNWQRLSLSQTGPDTKLINQLYKIHYLQWTGHQVLDQVLGILGLVLLILLTALGIRLYLKARV
ncbi:PepSY-associated TM region [Colwellia chukchiensis]|uniref:PepSY-associated TM region n=1 Tax=Colwellia chukchiensis TaxID=641665 RepID=A0A1H7QS27_9GAMM|nr:PepSY domain-containing protein [Colwellia chukchiensis]SEL50435.1 PepSY-associated TM region [Colwellia chukchiensis]